MLTPRQLKALQALVTEPTRAAAAKSAGVAERTLRQYLENPEFLAEYRRAYSDALEDAARRAAGALGVALSTLEELADNSLEPGQTRATAAKGLIDAATRLYAMVSVERRLTELEKRMVEAGNNGDH